MNGTKKTISLLLALLLLCSLLSGAAMAAGEYDTMADWDLQIAIPDTAAATEYDGSDGCYYIYMQEYGVIPYVLVTMYDLPSGYSSEEQFLDEFTAYMGTNYEDLTVTSEAASGTIGGKNCCEIEYAYTISGYDAKDRRIVILDGDRIYMFASKEVEELGMTVGTALEDVVAGSVILSETPATIDAPTGSDTIAGTGTAQEPAAGTPAEPDNSSRRHPVGGAWVYRQEDGMPKYWIDMSGMLSNNLVLHCYFRSGDPTFYDAWFVLDTETAEDRGDSLVVHTVYDQYGEDVSAWFESFILTIQDDDLVLDVIRNESTLAGGSDDNILTGTYQMEPMSLAADYAYYQEDGMLKYWMDPSEGPDIVLHGMFRSGDPEFHEETYTLSLQDANWENDYVAHINTVLDGAGNDVSARFASLILSEVQGAVMLSVQRDESTLAGGADDNILTGVYMLEPSIRLLPYYSAPFSPEDLGFLAQVRYLEHTGFFPPSADVQDNGDGTYTIQLYETVEQDGVTHTGTSAWYTVDDSGAGTDDITGAQIDLTR